MTTFPGGRNPRDLAAAWRVLGSYHALGPVVQAHLLPDQRLGNEMTMNGPLLHEMLHAAHIPGSSIGLLDAALAASMTAIHGNFSREGRRISPNMPLVARLQDQDVDDLERDTLDSILLMQSVRKVFSGVALDEHGHSPWIEDVRAATRRFQRAYAALFPDADLETFRDLDGRAAVSRATPAAPPYALGHWSVGSDMIFEGLASTFELRRGNASASHPFHFDGPGAVPSKYRGAQYLLFDEISGIVDRDGPIIDIPQLFVAFAEIAVNPAILPSQLHLWGKRPTWSDLHPGYRLVNLAFCIDRVGTIPLLAGESFSISHADLLDFMDAVCAEMEWPAYTETLRAAADVDHAPASPFTAMTMPGALDRHVLMLQGIVERKLAAFMDTMLLSPTVWNNQDELCPSAIVGWDGDGAPSTWFFDGTGTGLMRALTGVIIEELYFCDRFTVASSLLEAANGAFGANLNLWSAIDSFLSIAGLENYLDGWAIH